MRQDALRIKVVADQSSQGWDEGVQEMSLGEKSILTITGYVLRQITVYLDLVPMQWHYLNPYKTKLTK